MWHALFYDPLYNLLILLIDIVPGHNVGVSVILITVIVSALLFSLSKKAVKTQIKMRELQPEFDKIKAIPQKDEQAKKMLELYRLHKINPFSMIGVLLIQIPIFIALSYIFFRGGLPSIQNDLLYTFIKIPSEVNMHFLGVNMAERNVIFAILAGITHFIQARIAIPKHEVKSDKPSLKEDFARSMNSQARYTLPVLTFVFSLGFPSAMALYFVVRNIFVSLQEVFIKRQKSL